MPLVGLPDGPPPAQKIRLLRLSDGDCELLHAVREVDDAALLDQPIKGVAEDPLVEGVTLIGGRPVALLDGHQLFARCGEPPETAEKPVCRLPETDWARTILGPLVLSAGYDIAGHPDEKEDVAIWFEDEYEAAAALDMPFATPVIRLRDIPDAPDGVETVYRYDRAGLIEALRQARFERKQAR